MIPAPLGSDLLGALIGLIVAALAGFGLWSHGRKSGRAAGARDAADAVIAAQDAKLDREIGEVAKRRAERDAVIKQAAADAQVEITPKTAGDLIKKINAAPLPPKDLK